MLDHSPRSVSSPRPALVLAVLCALLAACATSPTGRRQLKLFPEGEMDAMGLQSFDQLKQEKAISHEAAVNRYVDCVASALIAQLPAEERDGWEVVVFEDASANAFALPGRKIGVHTGLLEIAIDQSQLAAVVGHEIGHVLAGHSNERMSQQFASQAGMAAASVMTDTTTLTGQTTMAVLGLGAQYGVLLPYSRSHEAEADIMGLDLMSRAGFDPQESVELWRRMASASGGQQPPELLSTHPSHDTRIRRLEAGLPEAMALREQAVARGLAPRCGP